MSGRDGCVIRDPIQGYIELTEQEKGLVDAPAFQRMRGIKQLANTHLVFPGATHTRFDHSLGTAKAASRMIDRIESLKSNPELRKQIRLAALLHDLGHGPFSHVCEDVVDRIIDPKCVNDDQFSNVCIACDALSLDETIRDCLGSDVDGVLEILSEANGKSTATNVISGPIDADKHDYLLRDSHFAGVPYGQFDSQRTLYSLREISDIEDSGRGELGISEKGVEAVQSLHLARYHMHRVVYSHKTRVIADAMVTRSMVLASEEEGVVDANLFRYRKDDSDFIKGYLKVDDRDITRLIQVKGKESKKLMDGVASRRLFKLAYEVDVGDLRGKTKLSVLKMDRNVTRKIEEDLAKDAGIDANTVFVSRETISNPTYRNPAGIPPEKLQLLVEDKAGGQPLWIYEMPGIWSADQSLAVNRLRVFSPENSRSKVSELAKRRFENETG